MTFGENLVRLRTAKGFKTQRAFALALAADQPRVSDWENDRYELPDIRTLLLLATTLRVSIDDLIVGVGLDPAYDAVIEALPSRARDEVGAGDHDSAPAHVRTLPAHAGPRDARAAPRPPESDLLPVVAGRVSYAEEEDLATAREAIERILAELTTVAERLPRRQAAVARRSGSGGAARPRRARRSPDRKSAKKAKGQ